MGLKCRTAAAAECGCMGSMGNRYPALLRGFPPGPAACCCAPRALPNFLHPLEWPRTAPRPCTPGQPLKSGKGGVLASTQPLVRGCRQRAAAAGGSELSRGSDGAESPWDGRDEAEPRPLHLPNWLWRVLRKQPRPTRGQGLEPVPRLIPGEGSIHREVGLFPRAGITEQRSHETGIKPPAVHPSAAPRSVCTSQ